LGHQQKPIEGLLMGLVLVGEALGVGLFHLFHAHLEHFPHEIHVLRRHIGRESGRQGERTHHALGGHGVLHIGWPRVGFRLLDHAGHKLRIVDAFIPNWVCIIWLVSLI
jgi:hypothetical protein